jgi:hypothetical protein
MSGLPTKCVRDGFDSQETWLTMIRSLIIIIGDIPLLGYGVGRPPVLDALAYQSKANEGASAETDRFSRPYRPVRQGQSAGWVALPLPSPRQHDRK